MIVKVKRVTFDDLMELTQELGNKAHYFEVPSTLKGVKFKGVYTDATCKEIAVAWPIDRPEAAQKDFEAKASCGQPVAEFEIADTLN